MSILKWKVSQCLATRIVVLYVVNDKYIYSLPITTVYACACTGTHSICVCVCVCCRTEDALGELLREIERHSSSVRFEAMANILAIHCQSDGILTSILHPD